jgi:hypothetical protein
VRLDRSDDEDFDRVTKTGGFEWLAIVIAVVLFAVLAYFVVDSVHALRGAIPSWL